VSLKVIVVGNGMVGKTSMITRFARGIMTDNYKKTIGTGPCFRAPCRRAH
jgi:Ras-related protein Rab-23